MKQLLHLNRSSCEIKALTMCYSKSGGTTITKTWNIITKTQKF